MPGDRAPCEIGMASIVGAGFALPRDAGRRPPPGELASAPCPRDSARVAMRGFVGVKAGFALPRDRGRGCWGGFRAPARCRSETGAPSGPRASAVLRALKTNGERTPFAARDFGGKCERGFHKTVMTNRNSPPRAEGAQGSFDCRRRRADPGRGPNSKQNYDPKLFRIMAPSGDRSTLIAGRRPALQPTCAGSGR